MRAALGLCIGGGWRAAMTGLESPLVIPSGF
jgi:hypothetical protein